MILNAPTLAINWTRIEVVSINLGIQSQQHSLLSTWDINYFSSESSLMNIHILKQLNKDWHDSDGMIVISDSLMHTQLNIYIHDLAILNIHVAFCT